MKEPSSLIWKIDLTSHDMREVVIHTAESVSTREDTWSLVKIFDNTYAKLYFEQVDDNATHMNAEEITQLISLLGDFECLFDGTLGDWDIEPVNLELNDNSKPFSCKYYPAPRINKGVFHKELEQSVKIVVLNPEK